MQLSQEQFDNIIDLLGVYSAKLAIVVQVEHACILASSDGRPCSRTLDQMLSAANATVRAVDAYPSVIIAKENAKHAYNEYTKALRQLYFPYPQNFQILSFLWSLKSLHSVYTDLKQYGDATGFTTLSHNGFGHETDQVVSMGIETTAIMARLNRDFERPQEEAYRYTGRYRCEARLSPFSGEMVHVVYDTLKMSARRENVPADAPDDTRLRSGL